MSRAARTKMLESRGFKQGFDCEGECDSCKAKANGNRGWWRDGVCNCRNCALAKVRAER